jgi:DNA-binding transcriptional MerR regulator
MSGRSYLSIGDVLTLLRQEFEDITISKIRFLESQGLVNPERTPSGYRKFYEHDVERLRWVLRQQREHFLPLKVIKDRLDDGSAEDGDGATPVAASHTAKVSGRRARSGTADVADAPDEALALDPVLVGRRITAEADARSTSVSSHPAGEGAGLPGIASPGEHEVEVPPTVSGGTTRAPARSGSASHRRTPDRAPLLELVNEGTAGGSRAASSADPGNGTGEGATVGAATSGTPTSATAATGSAEARSPSPGPVSGPSSGASGAGPPASVPRVPKGGATPGTGSPAAEPPGSTPSAPPDPSSDSSFVKLSAEELAAASGLDVTLVRELQAYGLLVPSLVAGVEYFDEEALAVASVAAHFTRFGIEPRHLRLYKNAAEREAGFVEQVVLPLVRQRNPEARARAHDTADELTRLGQQLRASLLRSALADLLNG